MTRPLVLIPSSKAKEQGGADLPYGGSCAVQQGPLAGPRHEVLEAIEAAAEELDDAGIMRLCGVKPGEVDARREHLRTIRAAPTLPAHRRYTGVVHRFGAFDETDPARAGAEVAVFTGLLGIALAHEPVPSYRLEVTGRVPGLGVLGTWWRQRLGEHLRELGASRQVWDLLPGEFARLWPPSDRGGLEVVTVRFERRDGRAAPSASAKVAKGLLLRLILDEPATTPEALVTEQPVEGWSFQRRDHGLAAVETS